MRLSQAFTPSSSPLHSGVIEYNPNPHVTQEPSLAPKKPAETMPSSRKILFLVAFVATATLIGLTDPAMGAPTSAAAGSIYAGSATKLFKRGNCEEDSDCVSICNKWKVLQLILVIAATQR
ncbi:MAG: hypothetical protein J3R72DRAFT_423776 [Linnemannia gamsii]|nr:MAG: hypothetical protein J3R72DRAFT_423776 [Linnemannia gamsii]